MTVRFVDLLRGVIAFGRDPRKYPVLRVSRLDAIPMVVEGTVVFKAMVSSEETKQLDAYVVLIQFDNVKFVNAGAGNAIPIKYFNNVVYLQKPNLATSPIKIKCTCPDFRFTWEKECFDNGCLIGHWRKYVRKTKDAPPRNPFHVIGYCKHVHSLLHGLVKSGVVVTK